ncbi:MAG: SDR family NAD(P)-dependent oxidoreductase [Actinomycetes bacterium]
MSDETTRPGPLDRLLDLTVVPGFTKLGYAIRSRSFDPLPAAGGKTIVITGASTGLGLATARMCAKAGASLVLISRDAERGEAALGQVRGLASRDASIEFLRCDLSDLGSVRKVAAKLANAHPAIDALVLNAGVLLHERRITEDGIELAWATNVVGPYLLEQLMLDQLEAAAGRVVMVTSGGAYSQRLALPEVDLAGERYEGSAVYARTKRAQIALAELQAEQLADRGIAVHAVHPGWADTPGVQDSLPTFRRLTAPLLRDSDQGADTIAWLALADPPELSSGLLWHDRRPRPRHRVPGPSESAADREALDSELQRLSGLDRSGGVRG